eukprot:scaffold15834_cov66-Phaeocystis_antarctica.AAC.3
MRPPACSHPLTNPGPPHRPENSALRLDAGEATAALWRLPACPARRRLSELKDTLSFTGAYETVTDGTAAEHAAPARREAAKKLIMNHERVLHDLTRTRSTSERAPWARRLRAIPCRHPACSEGIVAGCGRLFTL